MKKVNHQTPADIPSPEYKDKKHTKNRATGQEKPEHENAPSGELIKNTGDDNPTKTGDADAATG